LRFCAGGGPDLNVLLVNTAPTGTAIVVGVDQASTILKDAYAEDESYLLRPDPQTPPPEYMDRSIAIELDVLLESPLLRSYARWLLL
jgi:hypothetical protein